MKKSNWAKLIAALGLFFLSLWVGFTNKTLLIPGPKWFGIVVGIVLGLLVSGLFGVLLYSLFGLL
jgi:hypothetical protein